MIARERLFRVAGVAHGEHEGLRVHAVGQLVIANDLHGEVAILFEQGTQIVASYRRAAHPAHDDLARRTGQAG